MNKKFIALTLSTMLMVSFAGCSGSNEESSSEVSKNNSDTATSASSKQDSESSKNTESNLVFWCNQKNWKEITGTYDGTLLTAKVKAPIDLSKLDEYNSSPYHWFPNGVNGRNAESISEILTSEEKQTPQGNPTSIGTQSSFDEHWLDLGLEDDGIKSIGIYNYNEDDSTNDNPTDNSLPISTCYKNNWWYMTLNIEAFGVSSEVQDKNYQIEKADGLIEVLGSPTYMICDYGIKSLEQNEGAIYYSLVYDYGEYFISISINEHIMNKYNSAILEVNEITYYTKESWEQENKDTNKDNIISLK